MKISWVTSPLALAFAQKFLPEQTWVPFFNVVSFIIGTYINAHTKKKRLAALRRKVSNHRIPSGIAQILRQPSTMTIERLVEQATIPDRTIRTGNVGVFCSRLGGLCIGCIEFGSLHKIRKIPVR